MDEIYLVLNYNLEMQNGSFYSFMEKLDKHIKKPEFVNQCTLPYRKRSTKKAFWRRRKRYSDERDLSHFREFFTKQMGLDSAIVDPGTFPCAISNNTPPCWNGQEIGTILKSKILVYLLHYFKCSGFVILTTILSVEY